MSQAQKLLCEHAPHPLETSSAPLPSLHLSTEHPPFVSNSVEGAARAETSNSNFGYPWPGPQSPTPAETTAKHYFVDDTAWNAILEDGDFDDIVCGSGFCALAYVDTALKRDPWRKILILERGGFWLPDHFQNLPLPFGLILGGPTETFPWQLTARSAQSRSRFVHGSWPFFGGRSISWSAWSPRPSLDLMRGFPESMKKTASDERFWTECEDLLHVTKANEIKDPVFGQKLQRIIQERLDRGTRDIPTAETTEHAALAVGRKTSVPNTIAFYKFSTPGPLLKIHERQRRLARKNMGRPLTIAIDTVVQRFEVDPEDPRQRPGVLHTSRGSLRFPKSSNTNIILATGQFPATTILMNSIGDRLGGRAGSRVGGHFRSQITARFPITEPTAKDGYEDHLEIGASYVAGKDPANGLQYHIQITAMHSPRPLEDAEDAGRLSPDFATAPSEEQLEGSERHIVLVAAVLGELDEAHSESWVKHDPENPDITTNIRLQVLLSPKTEHLWDIMDRATYDAIKVVAGDQVDNIEYWHKAGVDEHYGPTSDIHINAAEAGWRKEKPPQDMIRVAGLFHETSSLYMSDDLERDVHASVDSDYRPYRCDGVYVTGGALFPTAGSWNPTLTMCGFAQDLARKLVPSRATDGEAQKGTVHVGVVGSDAGGTGPMKPGAVAASKSETTI